MTIKDEIKAVEKEIENLKKNNFKTKSKLSKRDIKNEITQIHFNGRKGGNTFFILLAQAKLQTLNSCLKIQEDFVEKLKEELSFRDCGKCGHESYCKFITGEEIDKLLGDVK